MFDRIFIIILALVFTACSKGKLPTEEAPAFVGESTTESIYVGAKGDRAELTIQDGLPQLRVMSGGLPSLIAWAGAGGASGILELRTSGGYYGFYSPSDIQFYQDFQIKTAIGVGGLRFNGIQVLGPQQPAIANATSPEDVVIKFNLLLEEMRNHGVIAR